MRKRVTKSRKCNGTPVDRLHPAAHVLNAGCSPRSTCLAIVTTGARPASKMRANASSLRLTYHTCPFRSPLSQGGCSDRRTRSSNTWQDVLRSSETRTLKRIPRCRCLVTSRVYRRHRSRWHEHVRVDPITMRYSQGLLQHTTCVCMWLYHCNIIINYLESRDIFLHRK